MRDGKRPGWERRPSTPALTALVGVLLTSVAVGCGWGSTDVEEPKPFRELVIFLYDRSGSMPDYQLELARELTENRVRQLDHGDRIVAMELLEASLQEPPRRWSQRVPSREYPDMEVESDSEARSRFLRDAVDYMQRFTDAESRDPSRGTDILSTLHDVAADLRAYRDRRATLYLFSDMLQASPTLNFERPGVQPPDGWVERAAEDEKLPDLRGLCAVVVGARTDTDKGQAVKDFWLRYFEATGATLRSQNYMLRPVELPAEPCGS